MPRFDETTIEPEKIMGFVKNAVKIVLMLIVALAAFDSFFTVKDTQRAVLTQFGRFVEMRGPGWNWRLPFIQGAVKYPINLQAFVEEKVNTYTVDNQELDAVFTVNYRNPASNVKNTFKTFPDLEARLKTLAVDRFKAEVGRVNVTEIAQKRGGTRDNIMRVMKKDAHDLFGVEVTDFQITNIDYNKTFRDANNAASVAKAKVEQAEQEKRQASIDAERTKIRASGEANAVEEKARGDANGRLLNAEAEAKAIRLKGEAEADAIRAQATALAQNQQLVELRKAEKWNGALPSSMLSNVILESMPHDDGGVDQLKDSLYSRQQKGMQDVRAPLTKSEEGASKAWPSSAEATGGQGRRPSITPPNPHTSMALATKFLIGSGVFFMLAVAGAGIFFFSGGNYISPQNIDLQIVAPSLIDGGTAANLQFIITNRNSSQLQLADLVVDYPDGTRDPKDPTKTLTHQRISVGTIAPGQQIKLTASAVFYGSEGSAQSIKAVLEYSVQGSNAVFVKSGEEPITIGSSPISVSVDAPSEAIAGQPFAVTVTVQSNSATPVEDVLVQAQYPFGFSVRSAAPKAESGSTLWRLGTMAPGAVQVIRLTGSIDGQDGDQRVFRFTGGTNKDQTAGKIQVPFLSVPVTLTVHRPFITASIAVEGKTGAKVSAAAGKGLQGAITWQNNLSDPVGDVQIKLTLSGPALDRSSIDPGIGFYQSNDNSITWTSAQDPILAQVAPGGTGTLNFGFGTLVPGTGGVVYTNPVVDLSLSVAAVRTGQGNVPEQVSSAANMEVSLASAVSLMAQALHFTGPFTNAGAMPPRSGSPTFYTIQWTVKNSSNTVAGATVSTVLPPYTTFVAGQDGAVTYDTGSRTVRWSLGDINAGVGYSTAARTGSFQVSITASDSQVGQSPQLTGATALSGTDRFAQVQVSASAEGPSTKLTEAGFAPGMDIVQPK